MVYGFGRIDASGRVADQAIIGALGWRGGDRLTLTAGAGVMVARRDPGGMVTVLDRPHTVIPAAVHNAARGEPCRFPHRHPGPSRDRSTPVLACGFASAGTYAGPFPGACTAADVLMTTTARGDTSQSA